MVRPVLVACAFTVVVAGAAADAAPAARRGVSARYVTAGGVTGVISGDTIVNGAQYGSVTFRTYRGERSFDVTASDAAGLPVAAEAAQDVDGDGVYDESLGTFCGARRGIRVAAPGKPVVVYLLAGSCGSAVSVPTEGWVTAHFTRR